MKFPVAVLLCLTLPAFAEEKRGDNPDAPASTAQEQLKMFHVPPGFEVQLVADESQIQKPMNLNFDAAGRLWVTGSELYPWPAKVDALGRPIEGFEKTWNSTSGSFDAKKAPPPPERAIDTVRVLSDFGPDGRARKVEVFADGLNIPIGVQPLPRKPGAKGDTVLVYSIPAIWRLEDTDGDGKADVREPLYTGFGFRDTHGMSSNYYYWIDGWIYGCHGFANHSEVKDRNGKVTVFDSGNTYRFRPDGSAIEYWSHGQTNPFGLCFDEMGNVYTADSHSKPVYLVQRGGYYEGIGKQHDGLGFAPRITDDDHGSSAIAGIAYYADDKFPEEFRGNLFNGNPVTRRINRDKLEWHGSSPKAIRQPDFLTCDDPWFRPIQVKLGPDGALWIADFYNPIIGHYEAPLSDPRRDHAHGRIWRVVWKGDAATAAAASSAEKGSAGFQPASAGILPAERTAAAKPGSVPDSDARPGVPGRMPETAGRMPALPNLTALDAAGLVEKLADPNLIVRTLATQEWASRIGDDPMIEKAISAGGFAKLHALLAVKRLYLWDDPSPAVRAAVTSQLPKPTSVPLDAVSGINQRLQDPDVRVVRAKLSSGVGDGPGWLPMLVTRMNAADPSDHQLIYAFRIALRDSLNSPQGFQRAADVALTDNPRPEEAEILAGISLAVQSPNSANFLLTHLRRTKFSTPRAGEYLKHAALYLPAEKFGEVASLTTELNDAPLAQKLALAEGLGTASRERKLPLPADAMAWVQRVSLEALASTDAAVLDRAIGALRDAEMPEKVAPLQKIAMRAGEHGPRRAAALEALMNTPEGVAVAAAALADTSSMTLRKKAAEVLAGAGGVAARAALLAALPTAPQELAGSIAAGLAKSPKGAEALLQLIEQGRASATLLRQKAVANALAVQAANSPELGQRAALLAKDLPPEDARLDGVIAQRVEAFRAASADGAARRADAAHGAQVFQQNCAVCHRFRNEGGNVGPNLDGTVARGVHRLTEDILDPNRNVDPAFRQTLIETRDGQTFVGANVREAGETVTMTDATGKDVTVAKNAIKAQTQSRLSLMPPAFEALLSEGDFSDLLAFLTGPAK